MRSMWVLVCLAIAMLTGCSKSPTKPSASDPYGPMYGTWEGQMNMATSSGYFSVPDSVRLIVAPSGARPTVRLLQRKLESASEPWPWREIPFTSMQVGGCQDCSQSEWDGTLEATCAP